MSTIARSIPGKPKAVESPVRPLAEPDRWTAPSPSDEAAIARAAQAYRDAELARTAGALGQGVARHLATSLAWLGRKLVVEPIERWLERERTIRELGMLSPRELADLGITPGEIPYVASGRYARPSGLATESKKGWSGQAVNENERPQHPSQVA
jgi:uncharacterized protein YjiS (DUF1127 family)